MYNLKLKFLQLLAILFIMFEFTNAAGGAGPILIKTSGSKKNKRSGGGGGGSLILISGGKGPTVIKGGGGGKKNKGGQNMIVVGNQGCDDKKHVHVVRQMVPVPYYVPKPIYKYILRHHYVPVKQYIMKPVPVPYPVKSSYGKSYGGGAGGGYDSGYGGGGSGYTGDSSYGGASGGSYGGSSGGSYGGSGVYGADSSSKYAGEGSSDEYGANYDDSHGNAAASSESASSTATGALTAAYKRPAYDTTPYPIMENQQPASGVNVVSNADYQTGYTQRPSLGSYKSATTNSYFYESPTYGQSSASSQSASEQGNYPLYAPVFAGPNGQYYTTNQVFNDTNGVGQIASPSLLSSSSSSSSSSSAYGVQPTAIESDSNTSHLNGLSSSASSPSVATSHVSTNDFLRLPSSSSSSSSAGSNIERSSSASSPTYTTTSKKYRDTAKSRKNDIERTKKLLTDSFSSLSLMNSIDMESKK